eukprot:403373675
MGYGGGNGFQNNQQNNAFLNQPNQLNQSSMTPPRAGQNPGQSALSQQQQDMDKQRLLMRNQAALQQQQMKDDINVDVLKWKNINLIMVMFTVFIKIIFLQILAYAQNSVPQTNGIAISVGASLAYFILTFVTLFVLFLQYEIVNFGYRFALTYWRYVSGTYGFIILLLGIIEIGVEFVNMDSNTESVWRTLSSNQKLYFDNSKDNLVFERQQNALMVGIFSIVIGLLILVQVGTLQMLYRESGIKSRPPMTSRLPVVEQHEQMKFVYLCYRDEEEAQNNTTLANQNNNGKDDEVNDRDQEQEEKEQLVQKERADIAENALRARYGAAPGEMKYDTLKDYQGNNIMMGQGANDSRMGYNEDPIMMRNDNQYDEPLRLPGNNNAYGGGGMMGVGQEIEDLRRSMQNPIGMNNDGRFGNDNYNQSPGYGMR